MLDAVNRHPESGGIRIATGAIADATIIHAPSSTKNTKGDRDPGMLQMREGNQWHFGVLLRAFQKGTELMDKSDS
jgi:IS5 family transposase